MSTFTAANAERKQRRLMEVLENKVVFGRALPGIIRTLRQHEPDAVVSCVNDVVGFE